MVAHDDLMSLFLTIGLSEQKAKETLKNDVLTKHLKCVIEEVSWSNFWLCGKFVVQIYTDRPQQI